MHQLLLLSTLLIGSSFTFAQYSGPSESESNQHQTIMTVKMLLDQGRDDQPINISGYITEQTHKNYYKFTDGTGTIDLKIKAKYLPLQPFDHKTRIMIEGKLDKDPAETIKLKAKRAIIVQ